VGKGIVAVVAVEGAREGEVWESLARLWRNWA
jgi:hypothetical protein